MVFGSVRSSIDSERLYHGHLLDSDLDAEDAMHCDEQTIAASDKGRPSALLALTLFSNIRRARKFLETWTTKLERH
jgi:hypothetical protein